MRSASEDPDRPRPGASLPRSPLAGLAVALLAGGLLAGCRVDGTDAAAGVGVEDSAGVRTATIRTDPGDLPELELSAEPGVRIRGSASSPGPTFVRLGQGAWLPDGRIVLLDEGALRIHVFGPDGDHLRSLGRGGSGPGEFESTTTISVIGDSIYVYDRSRARLSVFHASDGFGRSVLVSVGKKGPPPFEARAIGADRIVAYRWRVAPSPGDDRRLQHRRARLSVLDAEGEVLREHGPFARTYSGVHPEGAVVPRPYATRAVLAACDGGAVTGDGHRFRLAVRGPDGEVEEEIRWPSNREPPDRAELDSLRAEWRERYPRYVDLIFAEELLPDRRPAIEEVRCGGSGRLWAGRFEPFHAPVRRWWVLDPDARPVGRLRLPPDTRILDADGDRLLLVERNELDVESVTVRRFEKP